MSAEVHTEPRMAKEHIEPSARRFPAWVALSASSAVCLAAIATSSSGSSSSEFDSKEKWSVTTTFLSLALSLVGVLAYLFMHTRFVTRNPEAFSFVLLTALWGATVHLTTNEKQGIAVKSTQEHGSVILNPNLYFGAWCSMAIVSYLTGSAMEDAVGFDSTNPKLVRWYGLSVSFRQLKALTLQAAIRSTANAPSSPWPLDWQASILRHLLATG